VNLPQTVTITTTTTTTTTFGQWRLATLASGGVEAGLDFTPGCKPQQRLSIISGPDSNSTAFNKASYSSLTEARKVESMTAATGRPHGAVEA